MRTIYKDYKEYLNNKKIQINELTILSDWDSDNFKYEKNININLDYSSNAVSHSDFSSNENFNFDLNNYSSSGHNNDSGNESNNSNHNKKNKNSDNKSAKNNSKKDNKKIKNIMEKIKVIKQINLNVIVIISNSLNFIKKIIKDVYLINMHHF